MPHLYTHVRSVCLSLALARSLAVSVNRLVLTERVSICHTGLIPAVISPFVTRKIGVSAASRYFLTGERFSASVAKEIGIESTT
jgi:enoyl-CoA hydratase/carnithine racemase